MLRALLYPLPHNVKGCIKETIDGEPICILNSRLTYEANLATYKHELKHKKDFDNYLEVMNSYDIKKKEFDKQSKTDEGKGKIFDIEKPKTTNRRGRPKKD